MVVNAQIDPEVRAAMDAYIAYYNNNHIHHASIRSTLEAALKDFLRKEGHWPPKASS
jgi:hypothetical protein